MMTHTDTGRPRTYGAVQSSYFRGANGGLLVFNVGDRASFDACFVLAGQSQTMARDAVLMCCGVMGAGEDALTPRVVTEAEARARCRELGIEYFEADLGVQDGRVDAVFTALLRGMLQQRRAPVRAPSPSPKRNENDNENENT